MRIQHNIAALNSHRNLTNNNSSVSKNLEKLSSGYRINRAGDDAAGLAISEKMRAQITGLQTAQKNAEDGIGLVQTAEGALTEVHSMLNRMVELATQSANGTYEDQNRDEMQKEIDALNEEIDRISNTSNFNGKKLFKAEAADGVDGNNVKAVGDAVDIENVIWGGNTINAGDPIDLSGTLQVGDTIDINGKRYTFDAAADGTDPTKFKDLDQLVELAAADGVELDITDPANVTAKEAAPAVGGDDDAATGDPVQVVLHVGESAEDANSITVSIEEMSVKSLGLEELKIDGQDTAKAAITTINAAIDQVSGIRSSLGAMQNRLEHTINNLGVQTENITAAEARIRDVDMAKEMMTYTKNNILVQASQAMLAQANQVPQGVLQLLQ